MQYSYAKLRGRIVEVYGSQEKFAKALGVSANSLSKKMTGKTGFTQRDIVEWANFLSIDVDCYTDYFFA